jgi:hypothetical protein
MSEIKRYGLVLRNDDMGDYNCIEEVPDGGYVDYDDYESERLAHEQTKKNSDITVQALLIEQEAHEATRKELEDYKQKLIEAIKCRKGNIVVLFINNTLQTDIDETYMRGVEYGMDETIKLIEEQVNE